MKIAGEPVDILLVEDNPGDARLMKEALAEASIRNRLHVMADGGEALTYLRRQDPFAGAVRPDLILLDLNLPGKDGRDVLAEVKGDRDLRRIPLVILSTSRADADIARAYDLHANAYVTKPLDIEQFITVVKSIQDFWLTIVELPK